MAARVFGLAITHRLVGALGGTIVFDSLPGRGTRLGSRFRSEWSPLPPIALQRIRMIAAALAPLLGDKMTARILICEDQPEIRHLIGYFIEQAGGRVTLIDSGQAAVEVLDQAPMTLT